MNEDIAGFYLGIDEKVIRQLFEYYNIELESDKFGDSLALRMALIKGTSRWEVFPFESHVIGVEPAFPTKYTLRGSRSKSAKSNDFKN